MQMERVGMPDTQTSCCPCVSSHHNSHNTRTKRGLNMASGVSVLMRSHMEQQARVRNAVGNRRLRTHEPCRP